MKNFWHEPSYMHHTHFSEVFEDRCPFWCLEPHEENCSSEVMQRWAPSVTATVLQSFCQWAVKHFPLRLLVREVISLVCMAEQGCWVLSILWVNQGISWGSAPASPPPWSIRRPGQRLLTRLQRCIGGWDETKARIPKTTYFQWNHMACLVA